MSTVCNRRKKTGPPRLTAAGEWMFIWFCFILFLRHTPGIWPRDKITFQISTQWRTLFFLFILRGTRHCTFPCTEPLTWQNKILTLYRFRYRVRCHVTQESLYRRVTQVTQDATKYNTQSKKRVNLDKKIKHEYWNSRDAWCETQYLQCLTLSIAVISWRVLLVLVSGRCLPVSCKFY